MATAAEIISKYGMFNADAIVAGARRAGVSIPVAAALVEMESHGRNYYGGDAGGVNEDAGLVTEANFKIFLRKVMAGARSQGVGVLQITYAGGLKNGKRDGGLFTQAANEGYKLWIPEDNIAFGLRLLKSYHKTLGSWPRAAIAYNDGLSVARRSNDTSTEYARVFGKRLAAWTLRLKNASDLNSPSTVPDPEPTPAPAPVPTGPNLTQRTYTVQPGDTLTKIAKKFGTTVTKIVKLNKIHDRNVIEKGQKLKLPVPR